jgi:hypothetical protein
MLHQWRPMLHQWRLLLHQWRRMLHQWRPMEFLPAVIYPLPPRTLPCWGGPPSLQLGGAAAGMVFEK